MKNIFKSMTLLVLSSIFIMTSCSGDGPRRPSGGNNITPPPIQNKYVENPNWTITYTGRSVDTSNGVYVVDVIHMTSSDDKLYYLDLISSRDYSKLYNSNIGQFIEGSAKNLIKDYITSGDSNTPFDALDAGDGDWVALAYEVDENGNPGDEYSMLQFETKAITMRQDKSYELSYGGREMREDELGSFEADIINIVSHSDYSYYVDISYPEYINENYSGNPVNFFNDVLDQLATQLEDGEDFTKFIYEGDTELAFEKLRHGDWTAYAFGVDYLGNLTGNWSEIKFDIEEETPTEDFKKWLGTWSIGSGKYFYNISISSAEANQYFAIEDWETGNDASDFANQEAKNYVFEASYDELTKSLVFTSQYLGTLKDDDIGVFDVCFLGNISYNGQIYSITDINTPIAKAKMGADGKSADVEAEYVTVDIDGQYTTTYESMQFVDITDTHIYTYNDNVPSFPLRMSKLSDEVPVAPLDPISRALPSRRVDSGKNMIQKSVSSNRRSISGQAIRNAATNRTVATKATETSVQKQKSNVRLNNNSHR